MRSKPVLIFQHNLIRPPGYFADYLARSGVTTMTLLVGSKRDLPSKRMLRDISGLAVFGTDFSVSDAPAWLAFEIDLVRRALDADLPVFGHGLGAQVLAELTGGSVHCSSAPEIGWYPLALRPEALHTPWLERLSSKPYTAFMCHEHALKHPPDSVPLLSSAASPCQAFAYRSSIGVQFHAEITPSTFRAWLPVLLERLPPPSFSVQSASELEDEISRKIAAQRYLSAALYGYWTTQLGNDSKVC